MWTRESRCRISVCCVAGTWLVAAAACVHTPITVLPARPTQSAAIPAGWQQVMLGQVRGADSTTISLAGGGAAPFAGGGGAQFVLERPPPQVLGEILRRRLGEGGGARSLSLDVDRVRCAVGPDGSLGVAADFLLSNGVETKRIALEHSVNVPAGLRGAGTGPMRDALYGRAMMDLTDRLFYHADALAFLRVTAEEAKDSALLEELEVGPSVALDAAEKGSEASGRILWGQLETVADGQATLMLGETKGALLNVFARRGNRYAGLRFGAGLGGISAGGTGAFAASQLIGGEFGYRGTKHTPAGYVDRPGYTLQIVPQISLFETFTSGMTMTMVMIGGSIEAEVPIWMFGLTAGFFMGTGGYVVSASGNAMSGGLGFIYYPYGDLFLQTSRGRFSIGLLFQALAGGGEAIKSMFENPVITFTYRSEVGRGIAYQRSKLAFGNSSLRERDQELAQPKNVFAMPKAMLLAPPPAPPLVPTARPKHPPPAPTEPIWFYAVGQDRRGPVDALQLLRLRAAQRISAETLLWRPGVAGWVRLAEWRELEAILPPGVGPQPVPRPTSVPTERVWFYAVGKERRGPVDEATLRGLFRSGEIGGSTLLWRSGFMSWTRLRDSELADLR